MPSKMNLSWNSFDLIYLEWENSMNSILIEYFWRVFREIPHTNIYTKSQIRLDLFSETNPKEKKTR